jgi:Ras-related protein Rab-7A
MANAFSTDYRPTSVANFCRVSEKVDDHEIWLNIWDTGGQEQFQAMMPLYFRRTDLIVLVVDASEPATWEFVREWKEREFSSLDPSGAGRPGLMVCVNKCDLADAPGIDKFLEWATALGYPIMRTSALSGHNVVELFHAIGGLVTQKTIVPMTNEPNMELSEGSSCLGGC